jgi:hypothetical protein
VTVTANATPAVAVPALLKANRTGKPGPTVIALEIPVTLLVAVSLTESVWAPDVANTALKVPTPAESVPSAGSLALPSVDVKWTSPV